MEYLLFKGEFVEIRIIYMIFLSKRRQLKQVFEFLRVLIIYSQAHTDLSTHTHTHGRQPHTLAWLRISHIKTKSSCGTANLRETIKKQQSTSMTMSMTTKAASWNADKLHVLTMRSNNTRRATTQEEQQPQKYPYSKQKIKKTNSKAAGMK